MKKIILPILLALIIEVQSITVEANEDIKKKMITIAAQQINQPTSPTTADPYYSDFPGTSFKEQKEAVSNSCSGSYVHDRDFYYSSK